MLKIPTYVAQSDIHNLGLFSASPVKKGTVIWSFDKDYDRRFSAADLAKMQKKDPAFIDTYLYQSVLDGYYYCSIDNDRFTNHSDDPNVGFGDDGNFYALRDIAKNEEITNNYESFDKNWNQYCEEITAMSNTINIQNHNLAEANAAEKPWGQHLVMDMNGCPHHLLSSADNIREWTKELVGAIDMVAYGEPTLEHFATHSHEAAGYTLLQMIETSAIAAHFAENIGQVYIDIFSCKPYDNQVAIDICTKYFQPEEIRQTALIRGRFEQPKQLDDTQEVKNVRAA